MTISIIHNKTSRIMNSVEKVTEDDKQYYRVVGQKKLFAARNWTKATKRQLAQNIHEVIDDKPKSIKPKAKKSKESAKVVGLVLKELLPDDMTPRAARVILRKEFGAGEWQNHTVEEITAALTAA